MKTLVESGLALAIVVALGTEAMAQRATTKKVATKTATVTLSASEVKWILQLREEEKLARDVYLTLGALWQDPVFANIAQSEGRHMAAVKQLIVKYALKDPVVDDTVGEFTNPEFSALYDQLVAVGSASLVDAYEAGVTIEEMDIDDLTTALGQLKKTDIITVFKNLLDGSKSHLAAFESHL